MNTYDQTAASVAGWTCSNCGAYVLGNERHTCPTAPYESGVIPLDGWKATGYTHENEKVALKAALLAFEGKLAEHQIQMPPEFVELVSKHFWELV